VEAAILRASLYLTKRRKRFNPASRRRIGAPTAAANNTTIPPKMLNPLDEGNEDGRQIAEAIITHPKAI
jgi:hypothetical protein